ncbi:MAG: hypothetical protein DRJ05_08545, partial [Bacteroidetes bacterium]
MKKSLSLKLFSLLLLGLITTSQLHAQFDTLRVMYYNVLDYPNIYPNRDDYFRTVNQYVKADIILVNELKTTTGANYLLDALNVYGVAHFQ